jgi:hypothetical protein
MAAGALKYLLKGLNLCPILLQLPSVATPMDPFLNVDHVVHTEKFLKG